MKRILLLSFLLFPLFSSAQTIKDATVTKLIWAQGNNKTGYYLVSAELDFVSQSDYRNNVKYCDTTMFMHLDWTHNNNLDSLFSIAQQYIKRNMPKAIKIAKQGININWTTNGN